MRGGPATPWRHKVTREVERACGSSHAGHTQHDAQSTERRGVERQFPAVELGELGHDGKTQSRSRLRLIETAPAPDDLGAVLGGETGAVVVHENVDLRLVALLVRPHRDLDPARRPLAGVVGEVTNHVLEIMPLAAKARAGRNGPVNGETALAVN